VPAGKQISVDTPTAIKNFLVAVNLNLYGLRGLLLSDANILYGPVKQFFLINGYPFDTLIALLQHPHG